MAEMEEGWGRRIREELLHFSTLPPVVAASGKGGTACGYVGNGLRPGWFAWSVEWWWGEFVQEKMNKLKCLKRKRIWLELRCGRVGRNKIGIAGWNG
jgi:hypothetical protein